MIVQNIYRPTAPLKPVDAAELIRLYVGEKMNLAEVAERVGVSGMTVAAKLRKAGVRLRPRGDRKTRVLHLEAEVADLKAEVARLRAQLAIATERR